MSKALGGKQEIYQKAQATQELGRKIAQVRSKFEVRQRINKKRTPQIPPAFILYVPTRFVSYFCIGGVFGKVFS